MKGVLMSSIYDSIANIPVRRENIGNGDNAIMNTVNHIKTIVRSSYANPYVRRYAENIVSVCAANDKLCEVKTIHKFVSTKVRYTKDPYGTEYLQTPPTLLQMIEQGELPHGDCDDMTMLSLSLLRSIGYPVALKVASFIPNGKFSHIYGLVWVDNKWIPVECVRGDYPLGWEAPNQTRSYETEIK